MALFSLRAYSRHRTDSGFVGGALRAVQQAIESGRLKESLSLDEHGVIKINSFQLADQEWNANTRMDYVRAPEQAARVEAQLAASPPPAPPSPPPAPLPVPALPMPLPAPPQPVIPPPRPPMQAVASVIGEDAVEFILDDELVNWEINDSATLAEATKAKAIWAARQAALDYAEQRKLLIPIAQVETAIASVIQISKTKLLGIPTAAKGRIPSMTHGDLVVIESLIREALSDLCDFRPQAN